LPLQRYTMQNGLLSNRVDALFQDSRGYLWIGTHEGLSVYDGATFTSYRTKDGLSSNAIACITESRISPGTIWIGTQSEGINLFAGGQFTAPAFDSIAALKKISVLMEDSSGTMWCGTGNGVFRIRNNRASLFQLQGYPIQPEGYPEEITIVNAIVEAADRTIWIGNYRVIYVYSPREKRTTRLEITGNSRQGIRSMFAGRNGDVWIGTSDRWLLQYRGTELISQQRLAGVGRNFFEDAAGVVWICSEDGLLKMANPDTSDGDVTRYSVENGLPDNRILTGLSDREGNLWLSVAGKGLCKWPNQAIFRFPIRERLSGHYYYPPAAVDREGHFWVISGNGLLEIWQDEKEDWHQHLHRFGSPKRARRLYSVSVDAKGLLWIGFIDQDIHSYEITGRANQSSRLTLSQTLRFGVELPPNDIICFLVDNQRQLWLNLAGIGIVQIDLSGKPKTVATYTTAEGLPWPDIRAIYQDRDGNLWFGGYHGGVAVLTASGRERKTLRKFTAADGLPDEHVRAIHQDREGRIWLGTRFGGLAVSSGERFRGISVNDGLLSNTIWSITEDDAGRIWLGTNSGLQSLEKETGRPAARKAILLFNEVLGCGVYKNRFVWMATTEELAIYDLSKSLPNRIPPPVHLTQFRMNAQTIEMKSGLEFPHDQNTCTFEYVGISLKDEKATRYQYRLRGLAPEWSPLTAQRAVTFAGLAPGTYTFEVKAFNNDGVPSTQPATLAFTILPAFWQQWWFRILAVAIGIAVLALIRRYEMNRMRLKDQVRLEQKETEKLKELDQIKSRFFTGISHEFRTPLTLILGPVEKWLAKIRQAEMKADFDIVQRNARRLQRLIDQLLDLSKLDAGKMRLQARPENIVELVRIFTMTFESLAKQKGIDLQFHAPKEEVIAYVEREKLEQIVVNLLSNAFKFTPAGGVVSVQLSVSGDQFSVFGNQLSVNQQNTDHCLLLTVKDTGTGIPRDQLGKIFDRFHQAGARASHTGTGIGLALTKELVELHHGEIAVESEVGKGTTFIVKLPLGKNHLKPEEIAESVSGDQYSVFSDQYSVTSDQTPATSNKQPASSDK
ncbi:MAG: two-component regulator propeller domain-containing protein, partial [bacterium]